MDSLLWLIYPRFRDLASILNFFSITSMLFKSIKTNRYMELKKDLSNRLFFLCERYWEIDKINEIKKGIYNNNYSHLRRGSVRIFIIINEWISLGLAQISRERENWKASYFKPIYAQTTQFANYLHFTVDIGRVFG